MRREDALVIFSTSDSWMGWIKLWIHHAAQRLEFYSYSNCAGSRWNLFGAIYHSARTAADLYDQLMEHAIHSSGNAACFAYSLYCDLAVCFGGVLWGLLTSLSWFPVYAESVSRKPFLQAKIGRASRFQHRREGLIPNLQDQLAFLFHRKPCGEIRPHRHRESRGHFHLQW